MHADSSFMYRKLCYCSNSATTLPALCSLSAIQETTFKAYGYGYRVSHVFFYKVFIHTQRYLPFTVSRRTPQKGLPAIILQVQLGDPNGSFNVAKMSTDSRQLGVIKRRPVCPCGAGDGCCSYNIARPIPRAKLPHIRQIMI